MNPTDADHPDADAPDRSTGRAASTWFHPDGTLSRDGWDVVVDGSLPGWRHTGLRVAELAGRRLRLEPDDIERLLVPLHGSFEVEITADDADDADGHVITLEGRPSVFSGPTDTLYLPPGTAATVSGSGRLAVAAAAATRPGRIRHLEADEAPVELRGRGRSSREVHDLGTPAVLDAERLIVCEVITPAGNWSSYPPHKHDEEIPGLESQLEEIYYFEAAPVEAAPSAGAREDAGSPHPNAEAFGLFTASSSDATPIAIDERVRTGDVALIPGGYHGPAAAAPGYDLYYLNVMAGPGERVWRITDDPAHAWMRETWDHEPIDPRLPLRRDPEGTPQ